jgi:polyisoprenoid-binding protein YceI
VTPVSANPAPIPVVEADDTGVIPAGTWAVDVQRSNVTFTVKHMLLATVKGRFREFEGKFEVGSGGAHVKGTVKAASVDTNEPVRDGHLRSSPDFFDVERFPEIGFSSTRIEYLGGPRMRIVGELTMRGVTREIELDAQLEQIRREADGKEHLELELHGELNRRDFGLSWNQALETGGALLGNKVKIALDVSAVKSEAGSCTDLASVAGTDDVDTHMA